MSETATAYITTIAEIPDAGVRRQTAAAAALDRRAQLVRYVDAYEEVYGMRLNYGRLAKRDELLTALETLATA